MSERQEQSLAPSSISASPDDLVRRPRSGRVADKRGVGRGLGMTTILIILIAGLAVAGWFVANQHQQLAESERGMAAALVRIGLLEERLRMTDESMTESGVDTNEQLTFWEAEIRKLWDITNKRNRLWIEENQETIQTVESSIVGVQGVLKDMKSSVSRHEENFKDQREIIDRLSAIGMQVRQLVGQQRDLVDKINATNQVAASLKASLESRVRENEQAIAAIDAYRLQVNSRLNDLERVPDPSFTAP